ncbi:MAG: AEC family transporter [Clostridiales bacterium]|jgi:predicted permease|nr:AEC family transporter [Clostridiales bacterium]
MDFTNTLINVLVLTALAVPGFILKRTKKLGGNASKYLVNIILYVCQPMIVVSSFQKADYTPEMLLNMLYAFLIGFFGIAATGAAALFIAKKLSVNGGWRANGKLRGKTNGGAGGSGGIGGNVNENAGGDGRARAIAFACAFGNVAFMGIPVISVLLPENPEAIIYLTVLTVAFNILSWTLGAYIISGRREYIALKKAVVNPPTLAVFIALPLFFLGVRLDARLVSGISYLGDMVTPLSMTVLGMRFADVKLKELFGGVSVYAVSFVKLVAVPALLYLALLFLNLDSVLEITLYIIFLMPCANNLLLFAEHFDGDTAFAAKAVLLTTVFSAFTISAMLLLPL